MKEMIQNVVSKGTEALIEDAKRNTAYLKANYFELCGQMGVEPEDWDGEVIKHSLELGNALDVALSREAFYQNRIEALATK